MALHEYVHPKDTLSIEASRGLDAFFRVHADKPILFLFSGGSALSALETLSPATIPDNLTAAPIDERLTNEITLRNMTTFKKTRFAQYSAERPGVRIVDPCEPSIDEASKKMDTFLRDWKKDNPRGTTIALLGIGGDGHSAGIFPDTDTKRFAKRFFDSSLWTLDYEPRGAQECPRRLTVTGSFMESQIDIALIFVQGEGKREALTRFRHGGAAEETPALILKKIPSVLLYTDISR